MVTVRFIRDTTLPLFVGREMHPAWRRDGLAPGSFEQMGAETGQYAAGEVAGFVTAKAEALIAAGAAVAV